MMHGDEAEGPQARLSRQVLPRAARLGLAVLGVASLLPGLAIGCYLLLGAGMSHGHGGDFIPDFRMLLVYFLPVFMIGIGVSGILCTTVQRLTVLCALLLLLLFDVVVLASL
jgi:hypothetical protein